MSFPRARLLLVPLLLAAASLAAGQGTRDWFERDPEAAAYAGIRSGVEALSLRAQGEGLPESLLLRRLVEGAAKRAEPERLLLALSEETERLVALKKALGGRGLLPRDPAKAEGILAEGSVILRAGVGLPLLLSAVDASLGGGAGPDASAARAYAALGAAISVNARFPLGEAAFRALALALAGSSLPEGRFGAFVAVFARGRASGLAADRIAEISVAVLDAGGSLDRVEKELERRMRKP